MTCLGERITTLADGELGHNARDRALAHIASCASCRAAVEAERALKARLALGETPVPSAELTSRLLRLAEPGDPLPPPTVRMPGTRRPAPLPAPGRPQHPRTTRPGPSRSASMATRSVGTVPRRARRGALATVGALSLLEMALGGVLVLGSSTEAPVVRPTVARFSLEHAAAAHFPLREPGVDAVTATFGQRSPTAEERSR